MTFLIYVGASLFGAMCFFAASMLGKASAVKPGYLRLSAVKPGFRETVITLCGGCAGVLCVVLFGAGLKTAVCLAFASGLLAAALSDVYTTEIPDGLSMIIAAMGLLWTIVDSGNLLSHIIGTFCVSVPLALIVFIVPDSFGGGDIKLAAACGLFLGWKHVLLGGFISIILGGLWGVFLLATKKKGRKDYFAFGPFLCIGMAVCAFYGEKAAELFLRIFDFSGYMF